MDGLSPNFGSLSTWTNGRVEGPQTAVFVRGGLTPTVNWIKSSGKIVSGSFFSVQIRPSGGNVYRPSSESVHRVKNLKLRLCNLSSDSVYEVHGPWSKIRPLVHLRITLVLSWSSVRVCPWDGRSEPKFWSVVHMDGWTVWRRPSSSGNFVEKAYILDYLHFRTPFCLHFGTCFEKLTFS